MEALESGMAPPCSITIPSDIITEILYRLPAKSVGRLRCVSKGWLCQLTEPQFIKTHQNTLNRNHLIISSSNFLYSLPFHQNHEEEEATLSTATKLRFDLCHNEITVEGCCNGLVLLSYSLPEVIFERKLVILNPTTGELVELPDLSEVVNYGIVFRFGFGYDSVTDDYKVVALNLLYVGYPNNVFVGVYSLKNNTWKSVSYDRSQFRWWMWSSDALVNECLHSLTTTKDSNKLPVIVGFCLKDENFTQMALPNMGNDVTMRINSCSLGNLGGKLVVLEGSEGAVWLMNEYGVKESWTKILLHGFNNILMEKHKKPLIFDVHGKILRVIRGCQMWIYNLEDGSLCKHVNNFQNLKGLIVKGICVESLFPLRKVKLNKSSESTYVK